jgi:hypothetical protein
MLLLDAATRLHAASVRKPDVHQHDVGAGLGRERHAVGHGARLADDPEPVRVRQERAQAQADDGVVVDDEDADGIGDGRHL